MSYRAYFDTKSNTYCDIIRLGMYGSVGSTALKRDWQTGRLSSGLFGRAVMRAVFRAIKKKRVAGPLFLLVSVYVVATALEAFRLGHTGYKTKLQHQKIGLFQSHSTQTDSLGRVAAFSVSASSEEGPRLPEADLIGGLTSQKRKIKS